MPLLRGLSEEHSDLLDVARDGAAGLGQRAQPEACGGVALVSRATEVVHGLLRLRRDAVRAWATNMLRESSGVGKE